MLLRADLSSKKFIRKFYQVSADKGVQSFTGRLIISSSMQALFRQALSLVDLE